MSRSVADIRKLEAIDHDALWPRDAENRFRIYAVVGDHMEVLCATPTAEGIGTALYTMHEDAKRVGRRLADRGRIGVLDVLPDQDYSHGHLGDWIVLPWDRGGRR